MSKKPCQVRVNIIEGRNLKGKNASGFSDPQVCVKINGGMEKHTEYFKETSSAVWNEAMFWELELTPDDFNEMKIEIEVIDKGGLLDKDELIGAYEFDAQYIYKKKNHEIYKQWVGIIDPESTDACTGYVKVSVGVFNDGDEVVYHNPDDDEEEDDDDIILSPSIQYKHMKLFTRVYKCESLANVSTISGCDPYVVVSFNGDNHTKHKRNTIKPTFNTELITPTRFPSMSSVILVKVMDHNTATEHTLIGDVVFDLNKVLQEELPPMWYHLYGDPVEDSQLSSILNKVTDTFRSAKEAVEETVTRSKRAVGVVEGSAFRGSILVAMSVEECEKPAKMADRGIAPVQPPATELYTLWFDLYQCTELHTNKGVSNFFEMYECVCEVSVGEDRFQSSAADIKNGMAIWFENLEEQKIRCTSDIRQVPDIFVDVYIVHKVTKLRSRAGYVRIPSSTIKGHTCKEVWKQLMPDPRKAHVSLPGYILYGIGFGPTQRREGQRKRVRRSQTKKYQLRVQVYQARNLTPSDEGGANDPFIVARCAGVSGKTTIKPTTNTPRWYETIAFDVDLPQPLSLAPKVQIICMDHDKFFDDMIGQISLDLEEQAKSYTQLPKWWPIFHLDKKKSEGEILIGMQLVALEELARTPLEPIEPRYKDCIVEVQALGVRGLKPVRFQAVEEPQLRFCIGDKVEGNRSRKSTRPSKKPNGSSANFLEVLNISAKMPINPIFAPCLELDVYDNRITGWRHVATGSFWLGQYLPWCTAADIAAYEKVEEIVFEEEAVDVDEDLLPRDQLVENIALWNEIEADKSHLARIDVIEKVEGGSQTQRTIPEVAEEELGGESSDDEKEETESGSKKDGEKGSGGDENEQEKEIPLIDHGLEEDLTDRPFLVMPLTRGNGERKQHTGNFKGQIRVIETAKRHMAKHLDFKNEFRPRTLIVRVYVFCGIGLTPSNRDGLADSYLSVSVGDGKGADKHDTTKNNIIEDSLDPDYYVCLQFKAKIPGDAEMTIDVMNSGFTSDTLIGQTKLDLENRYFSNQWQQIEPKLRENRTLYRPGSRLARGKIQIQLEIFTPQQATTIAKRELKVPIPEKWELRLVVWDTENVSNKSGSKVDIKITCEPDGLEKQETDRHPSVSDGQGNFNYRMVWDMELPDKKRRPRLKFAVWDSNLLGANEAIGEAILGVGNFYSKAMKKRTREDKGEFVVNCRHPALGDEITGKIRCSMYMLPAADAKDTPVGKGRSAPNQDPVLPPPDRPGLFDFVKGGFGFGLFGGLFGNLKKKCMMCFAVALVLAITLSVLKP